MSELLSLLFKDSGVRVAVLIIQGFRCPSCCPYYSRFLVSELLTVLVQGFWCLNFYPYYSRIPVFELLSLLFKDSSV